MSRLNVAASYPVVRTHEGAVAQRISALQELRRSVLSALLWESTFYESGSSHAQRVKELVAQCKHESVGALAVEAREKMYLRHIPLLLVAEMAKLTKGDEEKGRRVAPWCIARTLLGQHGCVV